MDQEFGRWPALIRLGISVEGPTEEEFFKKIFAGFLIQHGVTVTPVSMGGTVTIARLANEMTDLFWSFDCVSSFVDFYGFKDKGTDTVDELEKKISEAVSSRIGKNFDQSRVISYVQRHEFETLLFSKVDCFRGIADLTVNNEQMAKLRQIRQSFETPEEINDDQQTAPSKRLLALLPGYNKRLHGPLIGEDIGLATIRAACPRFDAWLQQIERIDSL